VGLLNANNGTAIQLTVPAFENRRFTRDTPLPMGITRFNINENTRLVELEINSSILKKNYRQMISAASFKQVVEEINKLNIMKLDYDIIFENAAILHMDLTYDLKLKATPAEYINTLRVLGTRLSHRLYNHKYSGIEVSPLHESNDFRFIAYDKEKELQETRKRYKKELLKYIQASDFSGILRLEFSFDNHQLIRKFFKIPFRDRILLKTILESEEKAGYEYFCYLFDTEIPEYLPDILTLPARESEEILGIITKYDLLGQDKLNLLNHYKMNSKGKLKVKHRIGSAKLKKIDKAIAYSKNKDLISTRLLLDEILEGLRNY
jgi:hypothetical protein